MQTPVSRWLTSQRAPAPDALQAYLGTAIQYDARCGSMAKFRQVQARLHSGDCYQVNLSQRFQASYEGWSSGRLSERLNRAQNRAPFSAFLRFT